MRKSRLPVIMTAYAIVALAISLVANRFLYGLASEYYLQLNDLRLDPLGLNQYAEETALTSEGTKIVFFGDSRAQDWPIPPEWSAFTVANRGIGGQTSAQVAERFALHVAPLKPEVLILQVGINDLKTIPMFPDRRDTIIAACLANIRQIVMDARALNTTVILTTIFPVSEPSFERSLFFWSDDIAASIPAFNQSLHTLADEGIVIFDAYEILVDSNGLIRPEYAADTLHLNATGYAALNTQLATLVE